MGRAGATPIDYPPEVMARARSIVQLAWANDHTPAPSAAIPDFDRRMAELRTWFLRAGEQWSLDTDLLDKLTPISTEEFGRKMGGWIARRDRLLRNIEAANKIKSKSILETALQIAKQEDPTLPLRAVNAAWRARFRPPRAQSGQYAKSAATYNLNWAMVCMAAQVQCGKTTNAAAEWTVEALKYGRGPKGRALTRGTPLFDFLPDDASFKRHMIRTYNQALKNPADTYRPALDWLAGYAARYPIDDSAME